MNQGIDKYVAQAIVEIAVFLSSLVMMLSIRIPL